ncbi:BDR-repeat family protein (plasmid) [Borrelia coriaceae ATCC 43381]|uniref:BDR-repeat family protein n=1 Tax=Borrelia coriaceae ATCC 43381 TaxID=1408429 RepID=W5SYY7_9SPIR|nr:Bdr family repetitive protein [Borrelia coriaceae]AHH11883.1 BDR-repeat family protein [Borrelia coriaceae ATCC 43381]
MALPQPIITQQMVIAELTKAGINKDIAIDLSYRYYRNELTYKDIEFLKENFDIKLEKVEALLQAEIQRVEASLQSEIKDLDNKIDNKFNELDNKINTVRNELKSDIKDLDNKIDNVENNLNNKIDNKFNELDNKIDTVRNELKSYVSNEISLVRRDISNLEKNNKWIFGLTFALWLTILGGFIALILK